MAHSKFFSPSSLSRRVRCPGSGKLEASLPEPEASSHAEEGTAAHTLGETVLRDSRFACADYHGTEIHPGFTVDKEMSGFVQEYVDYVRSLVAFGGVLMVEQKVDFSEYIPSGHDGFGTADAIVYVAATKTLYIVDLKYGKGVQVFAEDNEQAQAYALGAMLKYAGIMEVEKVVMVIHQPRLNHVDEWEVEPSVIWEFGDTLRSVAKLVLSDNPPFLAGEKQCRWCKARAICRTHAKSNLQVISGGQEVHFENLQELDFVELDTLSTDEIAALLPEVGRISDWCGAVKAYAANQLEEGGEIPGYKLVEGRAGNRAWKDEDAVVKALKRMKFKVGEIYTKKLLTPAAADKLLTKKQQEKISDLIDKPKGKPTLAKADDKRPAITVEPEFKNLEEVS